MGGTGSSVLGDRWASPLVESLVPFLQTRITQVGSGCWIWNGSPTNGGYGQCSIGRCHGLDRIHWLAHRLAWRVLVNESVPPHLHHRCKVRLCVNPDHLEPIEPGVHTKLHHPLRDVCEAGHPFTAENTYTRIDDRGRQCRRCKADRESARYWKLSDIERHERGLQGSDRRREKRRTHESPDRRLDKYARPHDRVGP